MSTTSGAAIRYIMALLFLWFGTQQLLHPGMWTGFLPEWTEHFPVAPSVLIRLNGIGEVVGAILLAIGVRTRIVSGLLGAHLLVIAWTVGGTIGVRDAALGGVVLALAGTAPDRWTIDARS